MKKYFTQEKNGTIYEVDFENETFDVTDYGCNIDYSYRLKEDGILTVTREDGTKKTYEVRKDDLVLKMYSLTNNYADKEFIIISSPELHDYFERYDKSIEERKGQDLKCKVMNDCISCCEPEEKEA